MDNRLDNFIINNNCLLKNKENNVCSGIADMNKKKHEEQIWVFACISKMTQKIVL